MMIAVLLANKTHGETVVPIAAFTKLSKYEESTKNKTKSMIRMSTFFLKNP